MTSLNRREISSEEISSPDEVVKRFNMKGVISYVDIYLPMVEESHWLIPYLVIVLCGYLGIGRSFFNGFLPTTLLTVTLGITRWFVDALWGFYRRFYALRDAFFLVVVAMGKKFPHSHLFCLVITFCYKSSLKSLYQLYLYFSYRAIYTLWV